MIDFGIGLCSMAFELMKQGAQWPPLTEWDLAHSLVEIPYKPGQVTFPNI